MPVAQDLLRPLLMIRLTPRSSFQAALLATATFVLGSALAVQPNQAQSTAVSQNAAAAAPESPYHGEVVEDIVARVNDQVISSSDYARAEQDLETQAKQRNWSPQELDQQKRDLLRDLIDNQLLLSKGKQLGITGEAETIRQLDELRKQNHLDSMEALEKAAEQQNLSFADFKASIQNRVITSQVIRDEVGRKINITQADEQQYYDQHKDQFTTPETVKLSEILIPTADPDNSAQVATAQSKADDIEAQLKAGKDFAALAKSDSGGSTAAQGGDLGEYKRGQLAKVLEDDTFSLKSGEFTAPIRTKQGFVILRVDNHTAAAVQPFNSVQLQVEDAVGSQKMQPALRQYLVRLREEAFIQVKPGYIDASATNTEFRPIFSAYQPPQPKKKKKLARTRFGGRGRTRVARSAPAPVAPAGVPTLAEAGTASSSSTSKTGTAKTLKPGKREKVRYGQAPRETLPAASTQQEDAGASTATGNNSTTETAAATTAATENDSNQQSNVSQGVHYANGESATTDQPVEGKKEKTRFSQRAEQVKAAKAEKKRQAKIDPYPTAPADRQEVSDRQEQSQPLGLAGDTSKKKAKPKPKRRRRRMPTRRLIQLLRRTLLLRWTRITRRPRRPSPIRSPLRPRPRVVTRQQTRNRHPPARATRWGRPPRRPVNPSSHRGKCLHEEAVRRRTCPV
jgi:peptidyl-prolyl cis-trans isomerase SurA